MSNPFNSKETVYIHSDTAVSFGVLSKETNREESPISLQVLKIEEDKNKVTLNLKVDKKETKVVYEKKSMSKDNNLFVGWSYLILADEDYKHRDSNKEKAKVFLSGAIKSLNNEFVEIDTNGKPSPLAYYLISKYDLKISGVRSHRIELYHYFNKGDKLFEDFYRQLIFKEHNQLRKVMIAQKALEYYPSNTFFIELIANDIFYQKRYDDCINFIKEKRKYFSDSEWSELDTLRITLIRSYNHQKMYTEALNELTTKIWAFNTDYTNLLRGTVYHHQKNYPEAIKALEQVVIEDYVNHDACIIASYYLLECYLLNKDTYKLSNLIESFVLDDNQVYLFGHAPYKEKEIIKIFERVLASKDIDDRLLAKVKIMYAYDLQEGLEFGQSVREPLTKDEKEILEKTLSLVKEAIPFCRDHVFANGFYSNLLRVNENYDEAFDYKLRSIFKDKDDCSYYVGVEIGETSETYINNYPAHFKNLLDETDGSILNYIESSAFEYDIGGLWKHKKHKQIVELYKIVNPHITDNSKIGEMSGFTGSGDWFDIAYSLSEVGDIKECAIVYERILADDKENSSVLNNLAITYEKLGNISKAKSLIQKAKKIAPEDEIVNRNYERLTSVKRGKEISSTKKEVELPKTENKEPKAVTEGSVGYLVSGRQKVAVGGAKNVPFKLLEALCPFGKPKAINAVYNLTNTERSKLRGLDLSLEEKMEQLQLRLKELQYFLRPKRIRVSLKFNKQDETVFLEDSSRG